ncbi:MAG TPA: CHRD domain-containing protein [Pyrinomonadaceae bacterium]|nr:CHRD domain-containing protein [Pyrinomonadaceae bacterium]
MKRIVALLVFVAAFAAFAGVAKADPLVFTATLSGANERPNPANSPGTGFATVTVDGNIMTVNVSFSGLVSTTANGSPSGVTAAHIHCCAPATGTAGVATPVPTFPGFPSGVTSGAYTNTFDLTLASSYNPAFINANGGTVEGARLALLNGLQAGQTYFNIHSNAFPGGEIRGQLQPVPEPATLILLGTGLAGAALRMRKKRRDGATE